MLAELILRNLERAPLKDLGVLTFLLAHSCSFLREREDLPSKYLYHEQMRRGTNAPDIKDPNGTSKSSSCEYLRSIFHPVYSRNESFSYCSSELLDEKMLFSALVLIS
ncbi:hypothetical protein CEXT_693441 [Caerostris extrusa]|uniref:Uncharacterized protein n=1 Tax=Caerostris extrusa TaxID=172846 RepID=A0AAV4MB28_CAEEX|nr:hypothetical protein CEXT_693441 [Caerostris extrusa]